MVSEYQYHEFAAVDRPLDERQLAAVRALSTRAHITPTPFALETQSDSAWDRVATRIGEKKPAGYVAAVELLVDLREVTGKAEFARRVEALRDEHRCKPGLIGRVAAVGL